ncbi:protein of unknown function [Taphrina deformans PYCC 5710]|uniref:Mitochondrial carrier protein n=1 Tax=Taphrina deformans (strain PYCC 5710 / ATCC 11124 / CBS 356.35 / IMI 108563 / JCM 9778 / NBRC 8474) TaxID=1097556 RepID=R4XG33_TAPDE|nr:protein of unknown function [Taphrina deformans PYCC 5710]|eukprot:CCG84685.1 protein of unknown function [Taphrina deformans PYCC 5710]
MVDDTTWAVPASAFLSSLVSTICAYPVDTVKSRLQTHPYNGALDCVTKTWALEGPKAFFRGVSIPHEGGAGCCADMSQLSSATVMRTASFTIYERGTITASTLFGYERTSPVVTFTSGTMAGLSVSAFACPFELTKLASQLGKIISPDLDLARSPLETARTMYASKGLMGFWSGWRWHALRDGLGTGLFFTTYYSTKDYLIAWSGKEQDWHHALGGALCGSSSVFLVYPIDTIKAIVQKSALSGHATDIRKLDVAHLYRGVTISLTRSGMVNSVNFLLLEKFLSIFRRWSAKDNAF